MDWLITPPKPKVLFEGQPFIPYVKEEDFNSRLKPVVEPYMKRMGFLPNALKLYAYRPEIAETLLRLNSKSCAIRLRRSISCLSASFRRLRAPPTAALIARRTVARCSKSPGRGPRRLGIERARGADLVSGDYEPKDELEHACFDFVVPLRRIRLRFRTRFCRRLKSTSRRRRSSSGVRGRLLEVLQHGPRQSAHTGRVPTPRRHRVCRPRGLGLRGGKAIEDGQSSDCRQPYRDRDCAKATSTAGFASWSMIF